MLCVAYSGRAVRGLRSVYRFKSRLRDSLASRPRDSQKSLLEEIAEAEGQKVTFYPKFHCEFNYIEIYCGASKHYARNNCNYSLNGKLSTL
jgi:hypothetical protein